LIVTCYKIIPLINLKIISFSNVVEIIFIGQIQEILKVAEIFGNELIDILKELKLISDSTISFYNINSIYTKYVSIIIFYCYYHVRNVCDLLILLLFYNYLTSIIYLLLFEFSVTYIILIFRYLLELLISQSNSGKDNSTSNYLEFTVGLHALIKCRDSLIDSGIWYHLFYY
jgi:hypothetical protein